MEIVSYQEELSPALPTVVGNVDYQEFRSTLLRIDEILKRSGAERQFIDERIEAYRQAAEENGREAEAVSPGELAEVARQANQALRCNIARQLLGESARGLSTRLADSPLLQSFCGIARLDVIRVPSKSTVDRYGKLVDEQAVRKVIDQVSRAAADRQGGASIPWDWKSLGFGGLFSGHHLCAGEHPLSPQIGCSCGMRHGPSSRRFG